jgi:protein gp37
MSDTKIEWTDKVWNPITGCDPISTGCANCYAKRMATRLAGRCGYPKENPFAVTFHPERLDLPLQWKKPCRIFVNSMGDLFHDEVKPSWIDAVLDVIAATPRHTYQILTKRAENIEYKLYDYQSSDAPLRQLGGGDYLRNLWIGVTVESSKHKDRVDILRQIPAAVRFISFEPLLDDVEKLDLTGIGWVIVGGETGPSAREMNPVWARSIRDQCQAEKVPFFFKGIGTYDLKKSEAGFTYNQLDGRWWEEFPR